MTKETVVSDVERSKNAGQTCKEDNMEEKYRLESTYCQNDWRQNRTHGGHNKKDRKRKWKIGIFFVYGKLNTLLVNKNLCLTNCCFLTSLALTYCYTFKLSCVIKTFCNHQNRLKLSVLFARASNFIIINYVKIYFCISCFNILYVENHSTWILKQK